MNKYEQKLLNVIKNESCNIESLQELGIFYVKLGKFRKAEKYYRKALAIDINDGWTHLYIGNLFYFMGKFEIALKWFFTALELMPQCPAPYWCVANAYEKLHNYFAADKFYKEAVKVDPTEIQALKELNIWLNTKAQELILAPKESKT